MSAAARAEARRKAILSRGTDRLSKLTNSARGDSPVYMHDDPPLPSISRTSSFVGEEPSIPTPPATSSRASSGTSPRGNHQASSLPSEIPPLSAPDPSVWSEEQQRLMQALMGGMTGLGSEDAAGSDPASFPTNPFAAMLSQVSNGGGAPPLMPPGMALGKAPAMDRNTAQTKPPSFLQKILPVVHLVALWSLLAYFVIYVEPQAQGPADGASGILTRWAELAKTRPQAEMIQGWSVAAAPFFWAFITLEIALYSLRMFYGFDAVQPPFLIAMALPHLPPPFPSLIINGMKYFQLGSILFDDLAILAVGIGIFIYVVGLLRS